MALGFSQAEYDVTERINELVEVCVVTNLDLQRDGVVVSFATQDGLALSEFMHLLSYIVCLYS